MGRCRCIWISYMRLGTFDMLCHGPIGLCVVAALVGGTACQSEASQTQPAVLRVDSAGLEVVTNIAPAWQPDELWVVEAKPALQIGTADGDPEYELYGVRGAIRLPNGTLAIANAGTSEIRYFDAQGRYVRSAGRAGSGPGEFASGGGLTSIWRERGDTIGAWEHMRSRLALFDGRGSFVRQVSVSPSSIPQLVGRFRDGSFLMRFPNTQRSFGTPWVVERQTADYARFSADGQSRSDIETLPGPERMTAEWEGRLFAGAPPFALDPAYAVGDTLFYYGSSEAFVIRVYSWAGRLTRLIRRIEPDRKLTREDVIKHNAERLAQAPPEQRATYDKFFAAEPWPDRIPAHRRFVLDVEGFLWVQLYPLPRADQTNEWSVFDPTGVWLGDVTVPPDITIFEIGSDYIMASRRDELGVERLVLHRILKRPRSR